MAMILSLRLGERVEPTPRRANIEKKEGITCKTGSLNDTLGQPKERHSDDYGAP